MGVLKLMCPMYHLLSSLSWSQDMEEVAVATVILEEDVAHLEGDVDLMVADRMALIRASTM